MKYRRIERVVKMNVREISIRVEDILDSLVNRMEILIKDIVNRINDGL